MTQMAQEAHQAPEVVEKQWHENHAIIKKLCEHIRASSPQFTATIARGSSDHAATFAKYLFETQLRLPTVSIAPSVATLYHAKLNLKNAVVIGISQSGKSPDLCETMQMAKDNGGITIAIVNQTNSPLANIADYVISLHAGEEKAVAATKSYIASLSALIQLTAYLKQDNELINAGKQLPKQLTTALQEDWSALLDIYKDTVSTLVLGRGYGFPIAQEAALKFKETLSMHAEAFSGAEVIHGPLAVIKRNYPLLMFTQGDASLLNMLTLAKRAQTIGAKALLALPKNLQTSQNLSELNTELLNLPDSIHPICDPVVAIQAFYPAVAELAVAQGFNPDQPDNLQKVTETR